MNLEHFEAIAKEICDNFEVYSAPVPIEMMLQRPLEGMWSDLDVSQLSGSFLSIKDRYSPRMSIARLLVRHIANSEWGQERNLDGLYQNEELVNQFARILLMPEDLVFALTSSQRNPRTMSLHFEVPEDDARLRLLELA